MKLTAADFSFQHPGTGTVTVRFDGDVVRVHFGKTVRTVENKSRKRWGRPYKPCVGHATELALESLPKPKPKTTNHAKRRRREQRPVLRVVSAEGEVYKMPRSRNDGRAG